MSHSLARKTKVLAAALSVALTATAFSPAGCTVTLDEDFLNQVLNWVDQWESQLQVGPGPGWDDGDDCEDGWGDYSWDPPSGGD